LAALSAAKHAAKTNSNANGARRMICPRRDGHSGANNFQLFTPQGLDENFFKQCDKCRAHRKKTYLKDKKNPLGVVNTQAKARRAATLAANIAYEQQHVPGVSFPTCLHFYI
jgi:hypothetical protein